MVLYFQHRLEIKDDHYIDYRQYVAEEETPPCVTQTKKQHNGSSYQWGHSRRQYNCTQILNKCYTALSVLYFKDVAQLRSFGKINEVSGC